MAMILNYIQSLGLGNVECPSHDVTHVLTKPHCDNTSQINRFLNLLKRANKLYGKHWFEGSVWNMFLSLRVFGLLSSSILLFPRCFSQYVLRSSSGVCRTREPTWNLELRPLLNPRGSPVLIPFTITGYKC